MVAVTQSKPHAVLPKFCLFVVPLLMCAGPSFAGVIETFGTRHDVPFTITGPVGSTFPANIGAPFPELTTVVTFNDGTFQQSGPGGSVFGTFALTHLVPGPNNTQLFAGHVTTLGGTGQYAGATGSGVFAGVNQLTSPTTGIQTVTDRGFLNAPNISSPPSGSIDTSDGKSSGPFFNGPGSFDTSGSRHDVFFSNAGPVHSLFSIAITQPFQLDVALVNNDNTAQLFGPNGNFVTNSIAVGSFLTTPFGLIFSGISSVTGGSGGSATITGGEDAFVGIARFDSPVSGRESVTDYAFLLATPEPATWAMQLGGLLSLACVLALRRHRRQ